MKQASPIKVTFKEEDVIRLADINNITANYINANECILSSKNFQCTWDDTKSVADGILMVVKLVKCQEEYENRLHIIE